MRVWRLSVAYIGPRTERPRKTKIGTEVAHVTRDVDTTFKVKRSTCRGQGHIVAASRTIVLLWLSASPDSNNCFNFRFYINFCTFAPMV